MAEHYHYLGYALGCIAGLLIPASQVILNCFVNESADGVSAICFVQKQLPIALFFEPNVGFGSTLSNLCLLWKLFPSVLVVLVGDALTPGSNSWHVLALSCCLGIGPRIRRRRVIN